MTQYKNGKYNVFSLFGPLDKWKFCWEEQFSCFLLILPENLSNSKAFVKAGPSIHGIAFLPSQDTNEGGYPFHYFQISI